MIPFRADTSQNLTRYYRIGQLHLDLSLDFWTASGASYTGGLQEMRVKEGAYDFTFPLVFIGV
jgi:hypothetical protein